MKNSTKIFSIIVGAIILIIISGFIGYFSASKSNRAEQISLLSTNINEFVINLVIAEGLYQKSCYASYNLILEIEKIAKRGESEYVIRRSLIETDLSENTKLAKQAVENFKSAQKDLESLILNDIIKKEKLISPEFLEYFTELGGIIEENEAFCQIIDDGKFSLSGINEWGDNFSRAKELINLLDFSCKEMVKFGKNNK